MAKLTSALPKGEANGLSALDRELIDSPSSIHVVIALDGGDAPEWLAVPHEWLDRAEVLCRAALEGGVR